MPFTKNSTKWTYAHRAAGWAQKGPTDGAEGCIPLEKVREAGYFSTVIMFLSSVYPFLPRKQVQLNGSDFEIIASIVFSFILVRLKIFFV